MFLNSCACLRSRRFRFFAGAFGFPSNCLSISNHVPTRSCMSVEDRTDKLHFPSSYPASRFLFSAAGTPCLPTGGPETAFAARKSKAYS